MKRIGLIFGFLLLTRLCFAVPSNQISTPNSFSPGTTIQSGQVNANFTEDQNKFNTHTHTDIAQLGTVTVGVWNGSVLQPQFGGLGYAANTQPQGNILYFNGTGSLADLPAGTSGAFLETLGSGSNPQWLNPNVANGPVVLSSGTNGTSGYPMIASTVDGSQLAGVLASIKSYGTGASSGTTILQPNLKIVCGSISIAGNSNQAITNLPFTNSSSYTVLISWGTQYSNITLNPCVVINSASQCTIYNNHSVTMTINWIAIGN